MADLNTDEPQEGQLDQNPFEESIPEGTMGEQISREASAPAPAQGQQEVVKTEQGPNQPETEAVVPTQEQQNDWNAEEYALNYRGTRQIPASKEELINLAQKGYSYSQEMEKIKQQRQTLDTEYAQYRQFDDLLKSNPALSQQIKEVVQQQQVNQSGAEQPVQTGQLSPDVLNRINKLEQFSQQQSQREQDMVLEGEIQQVKQKYPNQNWKELEQPLIQFAYDNKINSLEHAYRAMTYDHAGTNARAEVLKQQQQRRITANQQGIVQNGQVAPVMPAPVQAYKHGDKYSDLARKMAQELSG